MQSLKSESLQNWEQDQTNHKNWPHVYLYMTLLGRSTHNNANTEPIFFLPGTERWAVLVPLAADDLFA